MLQILIENTIISRRIRQESMATIRFREPKTHPATPSESSLEICQLTQSLLGNASIDPFLHEKEQDPATLFESRVQS